MSNNLFTPILVSGADARTFLQGQLSCDVDALTRENNLLACINSAQGRVQAVLSLSDCDEGIVLLTTSSLAERTMQRLSKYVLRSKVTVEDATGSLGSKPFTFAGLDMRSSQLDFARAGIPLVFPETHEAFIAQMLNLDALSAISFDKGCYTGQEIIARTHYRGAVKRRMFRFAAKCSPPSPGTRVLTQASEHAGDVVYGARTEQGCELLAVINLAQRDARLQISPDMLLQPLTLPYTLASD